MFARRDNRRQKNRQQARQRLRNLLTSRSLKLESLEDRRLLAIAATGDSDPLGTVGLFLPGSVTSEVTDLYADHRTGSEALFYGAFEGEANDVKISGGYLDLLLMVDDAEQVPVLRAQPVFNRALLEGFTAGASINAGLGLAGGLDVGIHGDIGVGNATAISANLNVFADLALSLSVGADLNASFGVDIPLIELLGGFPDSEAIVPNPGALGGIVGGLGPFADILRPVVDFAGGFGSGTITIPDLTIPGISVPSFPDTGLTGFDNLLSSDVTIDGFEIPVGTEAAGLGNVVPGLDLITSFVDFFDFVSGANQGVTLALGDRDDTADLSALQVDALVEGEEGDDRLLSGPAAFTEFRGGSGNDVLVVGREGIGNDIKFEGGDGTDVLIIQGTATDEIIYLEADGSGKLKSYERRSPDGDVLASANFDLESVEQIQIFSENGNELLGGLGNDTLIIDGVLDFENGVVFYGGEGLDSLVAISDAGSADFEVPQLFDDPTGGLTMSGGLIQFVDVEGSITLDADGNDGDVSLEGSDDADEIRFIGRDNGEASFVVNGQVPIELVNFSGGTNVEISGALGDDAFFVDLGDTEDFDLEITGDSPAGGNSLTILGDSGDEDFIFTPDAGDAQAGEVTFEGVAIQFDVISALSFVGGGGEDELLVQEAAGTHDDTIYYSPGIGNTGEIVFTSWDRRFYAPLTFSDIETRIIDSGGGDDTLIMIGDNQPGINADVTVQGGSTSTAIDFDGHQVTFEHADGNDALALELDSFLDTINVTAGTGLDITINTGVNDQDTLNLSASGAVEIHSDQSTISQSGFGDIVYAGIGRINVNAGGEDVEVDLSPGPDSVVATPLTALRGRLDIPGAVQIEYFDAASFTIDGDGGGDVLTVLGSATDDMIAVDGDSVTVAGKLPVQFKQFVSLAVDGRDGIDQYTVVPDADIPIYINGGEPIGATTSNPAFQGDKLILDVDLETELIFHAGPEGDAGTYVVGGVTTRKPVTFDEIESIDLINFGNNPVVTVNGSNGDDDITVIGTGHQDFTVSVNEGPAVLHPNVPNLILTPGSGPDTIAIQTITNLDVDVTIDGGGFSSHDTLLITTANTETVTFTPSGELTGGIDLTDAGTTIDIRGVQRLQLDGADDGDTVIVVGDANANNFVHTPGSQPDAGQVVMDGRLPIDYQRLGADGLIQIDGAGGGVGQGVGGRGDTLQVQGTSQDDTIKISDPGLVGVDGQILHTDPIGQVSRVPIQQISIEFLSVLGFEGDDNFFIQADADLFVGGLQVYGGSASGAAGDAIFVTDDNGAAPRINTQTNDIAFVVGGLIEFEGVEQLALNDTDVATADHYVVVGYGTTTDLERLIISGSDTNSGDTLDLLIAPQPNTLYVEPTLPTGGAFRMTDSSPMIEFSGFGGGSILGPNVSVSDGGPGLVPAHELVFVGSESSDAIHLTRQNFTNLGTEFVLTQTTASVDLVPIGLDRNTFTALTVAGGSGDDVLTVDNSEGLIDLPDGIEWTGALGNDTLVMTGDTSVAAAYTPGPNSDAGSLRHADGVATQMIYFTGLEPVIDAVPGTLVVNGTNANNAISYAAALPGFAVVAVNGFETIEFSNKSVLTIDGQGGDDRFSIEHAALPAGLTTINIQGDASSGDDVLLRTPAMESMDYNTTGEFSGTLVANLLPLTVNVSGIQSLTYDGEDQGDTVRVLGDAGADRFVHTPGSQVDEGQVQQNGQLPLAYRRLGAGQILIDGGGSSDAISMLGTSFDDSFLIRDPGLLGIDGEVTHSAAGGARVPVRQLNVESLSLFGYAGDDTFRILSDTDLFEDGILTFGGEHAGEFGDLVDIVDNEVSNTRIDTQSNDIDFVVGGTISHEGVERVRLVSTDASASNSYFVDFYGAPTDVQELIIVGSSNDADRLGLRLAPGLNTLSYEPLGVTSGNFDMTAQNASIRFSGFAGAPSAAGPNVSVQASGSLNELLFVGSEASDQIVLERQNHTDIGDEYVVSQTVDGDLWVPIGLDRSAFSGVTVAAGAGDDQLTVDNSNGLFDVANGIKYEGTFGNDSLYLTGTTPADATYTPGPGDDAGFIRQGNNGVSQDVFFSGLEPILDDVLGTLTVHGTGAANTISYDADASLAAGRARVSVDAYESYEFTNKTSLNLNGLGGDDVLNVNHQRVPTGLTQIRVNGGASSAGDALTINSGDASDDLTYTGTGPRSAVLTINSLPVIIQAIESASLDARAQANADNLVVTTPDAVVTPGFEPKAGLVEPFSLTGAPLLPLDYHEVETVTVLGTTGVIQGTTADDIITISPDGIVHVTNNLGYDNVFDVSDFEDIIINFLGGDDVAYNNAAAGVFNSVTFVGGENGTGSDTVHENAVNSATLTPALIGTIEGTRTVGGGGGSFHTITMGIEDIVLNGEDGHGSDFEIAEYGGISDIRRITINAGDVDNDDGDLVQILGTSGPDGIRVTPLSDASTRIESLGTGPIVDVVAFNNAIGNLVYNGLGSTDQVEVVGSTHNDVVEVTHAGPFTTVQLQADGQDRVPLDFRGVEALALDGRQGDDLFDVVSGGMPIFVDGGDPIGAAEDQLTLTPTAAPTSSPGPEGDAGGFNIPGSGDISFDHLERIYVDLGPYAGGNAMIMGSGDDDEITAWGLAPETVSVQVNNGPVTTYLSATDLELHGENGDDDFTIDVNILALGTEFTVVGGLPTADQDRVRVTGTIGGADDPVWAPTSPHSGVLQLVTQQAIRLSGVESLVYDGESADDVATVVGPGRFVHTPGETIDSGVLQVQNWLALQYEELGSAGQVLAVGTSGSDTLVALGTNDSDDLDVSFSANDAIDIDLFSGAGQHIDLLSEEVENFEIRSLEGDDDFNLRAPVLASGTFALVGSGPAGAGDALYLLAHAGTKNDVVVSPSIGDDTADQDILGLGTRIDASGLERINLIGQQADDDTLTVNLGAGDNTARVERGQGFDLVTSDSLPVIEFRGLDDFTVDGQLGSDVVTFVTDSLAGATAAHYNLVASAVDTLAIEGTDGAAAGNDLYTVTNPAVGDVAIADGNGTGVVVTASVGLGRLQINTLGGDDQVLVDVDGTELIAPQIHFDGGSESDLLTVSGDAITPVVNVTYLPGPATTAGRLTYDAGMTIDFDNLEPVVDLVVATTLTVHGTSAANNINYSQSQLDPTRGRVEVDAFESIEFNNKTNLVLNGGAADDTIHLNNNVAPLGLTGQIEVNGGDSTTGDTVIISSTSATDTIDLFTLSPDAADVLGVQDVPLVDLNQTEAIVIHGGGGNDTLDINSPAGLNTITYTPGTQVDAGHVAVDSLVPVEFRGLGGSGVLRFTDPGGRVDTLVHRGSDTNDLFTAVDSNQVTLRNSPGLHVAVDTVGVNILTLEGLLGDDTFAIGGTLPYQFTDVNGGEGDDVDTLNIAAASTAVAIDLQAATIVGYGGVVRYNAVQKINADANDQSFAVRATQDDDTVDVTPLTASSGVLTANAVDPVIQYSSVAVDTITVDLRGGEDTMVVYGNETDETITVDAIRVVASSQTILHQLAEALHINGQQGSDTFDVTPAPIPIFIDGGNPIGTVGDTLLLAADHTSVYSPGPEGDEGAFDIDGQAPVSYDHVERVIVTDPNGTNLAATVMGTGDDDQITAQGQSVNAVDVTVNNGPVVSYVDVANLILQGENGDDDFDIDLDLVNLGTVIQIDGGLPTDAGDRVRVTGTDGVDDAAIWSPAAEDGGLLLVGSDIVQINGAETLIYDGESDQERLTVQTAAPSARFVHTPGTARDAGRVDVGRGNITLLGMDYVNLGHDGSVTVDGAGSGDSLQAYGTTNSDVLDVSFSGQGNIDIVLTDGLGRHVNLLSNQVENFDIEGLAGEDDFNVFAPVEIAVAAPAGQFRIIGGGAANDTLNLFGQSGRSETIDIRPNAANPDDQVVQGLVGQVDVTGIELIVFAGQTGDGDSLEVNLGSGDNTAVVQRGSTANQNASDLVRSDSLPDIQFSGLQRFTVDAEGGSDEVTFKTRFLVGAVAANYRFDGDASDALIIEGSDGALGTGSDRYTVTRPAVGSVAVSDNTAGGVVVTEISAQLGRLQINTLGGDDAVTVDVDGTALIDPQILFDGGSGSDLLTVTGDSTVGVDEVVYRPGPAVTEGRLTYDAGMTIDFANLEPVIDLVVAAGLTVLGSEEENDITYVASPTNASWGRVVVDGYESIDFAGKQNLSLEGLAGSDNIVVDNALLPTSLTTVSVFAGEGNDVVTLLGLPDASTTTFSLAFAAGNQGEDVIDGSAIQVDTPLILEGGDGNDTLTGGLGSDLIRGGDGDDLVIGGDPSDTIDIGNNIYEGGFGFDTIGILGTLADDVINVYQRTAATLDSTVNGSLSNESFVATNEARILSKLGSDTIRLTVDDSLFDNAANPANDVMRYHVLGDAPDTSDRLVVVDDGLGDTIVQRQTVGNTSGSLAFAPGHPISQAPLIVYEQIERVDVIPVDDISGRSGDDSGGRLIIFKPDPLESNDQLANATLLGADSTINVDPTIDPGPGAEDAPADVDWYRVVAERTGTLDLQVYFDEVPQRPNGRSGLPGDGNLNIGVYDRDGTLIAGAGPAFGGNDGGGLNPELNLDEDTVELEDERVRMPVVQGQTYYLRVFGDGAINVYGLSIVNHAPPVAYDLELDDLATDGTTNPPGQDSNSDTGRSQRDNETFDNTPLLYFRLDDAMFLHDLPGNATDSTPPDEVIPIPFNAEQTAVPTLAGYRVAVFIEGLPQQAGQLPQVPIGYARQVAEGVYAFDFETDALNTPYVLEDGSHFINVKVEMADPADPLKTGWGARSESLEVIVDTTPPPVHFGLPEALGGDTLRDGLQPDSDSGVEGVGNEWTITDSVTSDTTPSFWGIAEANAFVRAYVDMNGNGVIDEDQDVFIGATVVEPNDGTDQFGFDPNGLAEGQGFWTIDSIVDMNDPQAFPTTLPFDRVRTILIDAEDVAGNRNQPQRLNIFIDTQGPRIDGMYIADDPDFDLFALKPGTLRPTPLIHSLSFDILDFPARSDLESEFLYEALIESIAEHKGHFQVVGDHHGIIPIESIEFVSDPVVDGQPATATLTLHFVEPLPDDRITVTIADDLVDPAGNRLDGESNASQPGAPLFPTGDGVPGGDFVARFTVDSRAEIGAYALGSVYIDTNGNQTFDAENKDNDFTNGDIVYKLGFQTDKLFAGNFVMDANGTADGFDKLAAYGQVAGVFRWLIDTNNNGVPDLVIANPSAISGLPVAGNFDGQASNGDEVGLKSGNTWHLDTDHDFVVDTALAGDMVGLPVVGDFDGDGIDDLGAWADDEFSLDLSADGINGFADVRFAFGFPGVREIPVAADFNGDGMDDLGLWNPDAAGVSPSEQADWMILNSQPAATPLLDAARFSGMPGLHSNAAFQSFVSDEWVPVDVSQSYLLSGKARSGDGLGGQYDANNRQYFGFASYDSDQLQIAPIHVSKFATAVDTQLAVTLVPGATEIVLQDASGWANAGAAHQRSLAWYGYTNSDGYTYPDYSYTRNVATNAATGLWGAGAIQGNVITLNQPWAGPTITAGTAVRNATSGGTYNYAVLSSQSVSDHWTEYSATLSGSGLGSTQFRPGTAFIKPIVLTNYHGGTNNLIQWQNIEVRGNTPAVPISDRIVSDPQGILGNVIDFTPQPFGPDTFASFGDAFALPIVGNFDPPLLNVNGAVEQVAVVGLDATNDSQPLDVDHNGRVEPQDALLVINHLNRYGIGAFAEGVLVEATAVQRNAGALPDVDADGMITPFDVLQVVNHLNLQSRNASIHGEQTAAVPAVSMLIPRREEQVLQAGDELAELHVASQKVVGTSNTEVFSQWDANLASGEESQTSDDPELEEVLELLARR